MVKRGKKKLKNNINIKIEREEKKGFWKFWKKLGLSVFFFGLFILFLSGPFGNITGNAISQGNDNALPSLYLLGIVSMIVGALILLSGEGGGIKYTQRGVNYAAELNKAKMLERDVGDLIRIASLAGYEVRGHTVYYPGTNNSVVTISEGRNGELDPATAQRIQNILATSLKSIETSKKTPLASKLSQKGLEKKATSGVWDLD